MSSNALIPIAVFATLAAACGGLATGATGAGPDAGRGDTTTDGPPAPRPDSGDGSSCAPGESRCAGVCVDEQTDPKNCGGCGITCNGTCTAARCLVTIGSDVHDPAYGIAVDTTSVYWTNGPSDPDNLTLVGTGAVMKAPLDGGVPTTLYATNAMQLELPTGIAVDARSVYWPTWGGSVMKVPVGGGTPTTLIAAVAGSVGGVAIAVDGANVYWVGGSPDALILSSVPLGGGAPTKLAPVGGASGIASDGTSVYWVAPDGVMRLPVAGGTPTTLSSLGGFAWTAIAVNGGSIYWGGASGSEGGSSYLFKVSVGGGAVTTIASYDDSFAGALAVDATNLYWIDSAARSVPRSGGTPTKLLELGNNYGTRVMAVSATSLYWPDTSADDTADSIKTLTPK
jgi:hypothetical protein